MYGCRVIVRLLGASAIETLLFVVVAFFREGIIINQHGYGGPNIFVYLGGDQEVPLFVTHAVIDPSVKTVRRGAFSNRQHLVSVIFHDGVEIIEEDAFYHCASLPRIKLLGVREIGKGAFQSCFELSEIEFGNRLETIEDRAFWNCLDLISIKMPSVRIIQYHAFAYCKQLEAVEFGVNLETIETNSFRDCPELWRIAIPLKDNLFTFDTREQSYNQFDSCSDLTRVDIVGAEDIHKTISSLLLKSWEDEMIEEIDRINDELPNTDADDKTDLIRLWIRSVINGMDHYKAEHNRLLKEHMALLELAIWKVKLEEREEKSNVMMARTRKRAKIEEEIMRKEKRITSGADIIIKNVLPFLMLG